MRIYGNRQLKTVPGQRTRPTAARVREALFNIWRDRIADCSWLDLCAGNGSMGAEALARGACEVVGIERDAKACRIIEANWRPIATASQTFSILRGDIHRCLKRLDTPFDLIYFDPPYHARLYEPVLTELGTLGLLSLDAAIAAEHDRHLSLPSEIGNLEITKTAHYGQTSVTFYQRLDMPP